MTCPLCEKPVASARPRPTWFPFCSVRCQMADLGKWFDEEYRISEPAGTADESAPSLTSGEPD